jgi:hypothetical protein
MQPIDPARSEMVCAASPTLNVIVRNRSNIQSSCLRPPLIIEYQKHQHY